jgi:septum formation protein
MSQFSYDGIILASQSPRRKKLLEMMNLSFQVIPSKINELPPMGERPNTYAARLSLEKAMKVGEEYQNHIVIGADTVVAIGEKILGKPSSINEAIVMLNQLSNEWHEVWTGICVYHHKNSIQTVKAICSNVCFKALSQDEIDEYVASKEPFDKAGAYAIQGKAKKFIKELRGSYHNVVGLPTIELGKVLENIGVAIDSNIKETIF